MMPVGIRESATVRIDDAYFSLVELSKYAGLSVRTLRGYLVHVSRPLPHYRIGGKIVVLRSEFDTWVSQFKVIGAAVPVDALVDDIVDAMR